MINKKLELVIQDAKSYQTMMDYINTLSENGFDKIKAKLNDIENKNYILQMKV